MTVEQAQVIEILSKLHLAIKRLREGVHYDCEVSKGRLVDKHLKTVESKMKELKIISHDTGK